VNLVRRSLLGLGRQPIAAPERALLIPIIVGCQLHQQRSANGDLISSGK